MKFPLVVEGDVLRRIPSVLEGEFDLVLAKHLSFPINNLKRVLDYTRKALSSESSRSLVFDFLVKGVWFISRDDLERLLKEKDIKVEDKLEEVTGVNNLKGVTIYGKFS